MSNYFSTNLKYLREKRNLSQNRLASMIGVNQTTIARWEDDNRTPNLDNAIDVSKILNIPLPDLIGKDLRTAKGKDELNTLFDEHKDILTTDDKETIKFIIEKRKKEIDKKCGDGDEQF